MENKPAGMTYYREGAAAKDAAAKETRERIAGHMNAMSEGEVRFVFDLVAKLLAKHPDFTFAMLERKALAEAGDRSAQGGLFRAVGKNTGRPVDFGYADIASDDDLDFILKLNEAVNSLSGEGGAAESGGPGKAEMADLLAEALSRDTLFEGLFLQLDGAYAQGLCKGGFAGSGGDNIAEALGVAARWEELKRDPVFAARRGFVRLLSGYMLAAVNLYGALPHGTFVQILEAYEPGLFSAPEGYVRAAGGYRRTLAYSPERLGATMLAAYANGFSPDLCASPDGTLLNGLFYNSLLLELDLVKECADRKEDYKKFLGMRDERIAYRTLLAGNDGKPIYLPDAKEDFLRFKEKVRTAAEKKMRNFLRKRFRGELEKFAGKVNRNEETEIPIAKPQGKADAEDVLDFFLDSLAIIAGNGEDCTHRDDVEFLKCFLILAERLGISVRSQQDACALNDMMKDYLNDIRLWSNRGFTRRELRAQQQGTSGKVNRNAPCPCGSGLKYKKCCGRGQPFASAAPWGRGTVPFPQRGAREIRDFLRVKFLRHPAVGSCVKSKSQI